VLDVIYRQHGLIMFECDSCAETLSTDTDDFDAAWFEARSEGWRARKIGERLEHQCPNCAGGDNAPA
jgi:hypothetical protein